MKNSFSSDVSKKTFKDVIIHSDVLIRYIFYTHTSFLNLLRILLTFRLSYFLFVMKHKLQSAVKKIRPDPIENYILGNSYYSIFDSEKIFRYRASNVNPV